MVYTVRSISKQHHFKNPGRMAQAYNPSTCKVGAEGLSTQQVKASVATWDSVSTKQKSYFLPMEESWL